MGKDSLYTLISIEEFKSLVGVDDRYDKLARFCLVTGTYEIERYCMRKLLRKKHFEWIEYCPTELDSGDLVLPLLEYPVSKILAVYVFGDGEILEPEFYNTVPNCGTDYDLPFSLSLSPALKRYHSLFKIMAVYWAGYAHNKVPQDLSAACMELAAWNFQRYKGRRIGMTGNIRGIGKEGEHFEMSMPENVKTMLEPYKRRTI